MRRYAIAVLMVMTGWSVTVGQTRDEKQATIAYLQALQTPTGGFAPARSAPDATPPKASLRATSSALRALKYFGGEATDRAAAARFVAACFDRESGGFADEPGGKPDVTTTAIGVLAVIELKMPVQDYAAGALRYLDGHVQSFDDIRIAAAAVEALGKHPTKADAWLQQVRKMQNPDGSFGAGDARARETGSAAVAVLRLGGKVQQDAVVKALRAGQRSDGAFGRGGAAGSDLETTYRVVRAFHMLKVLPDDVRALQGFIGRCRNPDSGYGVAPGQPSTVSGTYFAAIILHWLAENQ